MKEKILYGAVGLLIGVIATLVFVNNTSNTRYLGMMHMGNTSQKVDTVDRHFIEQMIPHHADAILMGNLALTQAEHEEVKKFGAKYY